VQFCSSSIPNCSEHVSNTEDFKDDGDTNEGVDSVRPSELDDSVLNEMLVNLGVGRN
jgi:hypothetical protein